MVGATGIIQADVENYHTFTAKQSKPSQADLESQNPEEVSNGKITKDRLKGSESPRAGKAKKAKKGTKTRENLKLLSWSEILS